MNFKTSIKNIIHEYNKQRDDMVAMAGVGEHPNGDFIVNTHLCGKFYLQYVALMSIAEAAGYTSQEMIKRVIERGITNEFKIWKDASFADCLERIAGDRINAT